MITTGKNTLRTEAFLDYVNNMQEIDENIFLSDTAMLNDVLGDGFLGVIKLITSLDPLEPLTSKFTVEETREVLFIKKTYNEFKDGLWNKHIIYKKCT